MDAPSEATLHTADNAFEIMAGACEAIEGQRWNEADELLRRLQELIHRLRVGIRDDRFSVQAEVQVERG
jgi:hypothetical protein